MARELTSAGKPINAAPETTTLQWPTVVPRTWDWNVDNPVTPTVTVPGPSIQPPPPEPAPPGTVTMPMPTPVVTVPGPNAAEPPVTGPLPPTPQTAEMASAFASEGGPQTVNLPSGGQVTMTTKGIGNLMDHPWTGMAILDPEGFAKEHPDAAKMFTDPKTGKLDIEAIRMFETKVEKEAAQEKATSELVPTVSKKGAVTYGPPPPDFTPAGRKAFEQHVFQRLGGNPFAFNPSKVVSDSNQFLPDLFNEVFKGKVVWQDRDKLGPQDEAIWKAEQERYRATMQNNAIARNNQQRQLYSAMMTQWDAAAGRNALSKEARIALEKAEVTQPIKVQAQKAKEKSPASFMAAKKELDSELKTGIFKGKSLTGEEDRKLYSAYMKRFDDLRKQIITGKLDLSPADIIQKSQDDVNAILAAYWKEYDKNKGDAKAMKDTDTNMKAAIGYVPLTRR